MMTRLCKIDRTDFKSLFFYILISMGAGFTANACIDPPAEPEITETNTTGGREFSGNQVVGERPPPQACSLHYHYSDGICPTGQTCVQGVCQNQNTGCPSCDTGYSCNTTTKKCEPDQEIPETPGRSVSLTDNREPTPAASPPKTCSPCPEGFSCDTVTGHCVRVSSEDNRPKIDTTPVPALKPVPVGADGVLTQQPASIKTLSDEDFNVQPACGDASSSSGQHTQTKTEPTSGTKPFESKGGQRTTTLPSSTPQQPNQPKVAPKTVSETPQPTATELERTSATVDTSDQTPEKCSPTPPPIRSSLCTDPAYRTAVLVTPAQAGGTQQSAPEIFRLVNFSTHVYLNYSTLQNQQTAQTLLPDFPIRTLMDHTLVNIQNNYLIHGTTTHPHNRQHMAAFLHSNPNKNILHHFRLAQNQSSSLSSNISQNKPQTSLSPVLQAQINLMDPSGRQIKTSPQLTLGTSQQGAITLFAFEPETTTEQSVLLRNFNKHNTLKVKLSGRNCVAIYENAQKTKYPVVFVLESLPVTGSEETPESPNPSL